MCPPAKIMAMRMEPIPSGASEPAVLTSPKNEPTLRETVKTRKNVPISSTKSTVWIGWGWTWKRVC